MPSTPEPSADDRGVAMTGDADTGALPEGVFSDGGRLWRVKPGATSTLEESLAALALWVDVHRDEFWNPWRLEEQADDLEHAERVMAQWERAEPGFRRRALQQLEAETARWDREDTERAERRAR